MRPRCPELASPLADPIRRFIECKRALNRRFHTEQRALHLFDGYLVERGVADLASAGVRAGRTPGSRGGRRPPGARRGGNDPAGPEL